MQAIVLGLRQRQDYDAEVALFSEGKGFFWAFAKSLKKNTSKNASALFPGSLVEVGVVVGKRDQLITSARPLSSPDFFLRNLSALKALRLVLADCLRCLPPGVSEKMVFADLLDFLHLGGGSLKVESDFWQMARAIMRLRLSDRLGFGINFEATNLGQTLALNKSLFFDPAAGCFREEGGVGGQFIEVGFAEYELLVFVTRSNLSVVAELDFFGKSDRLIRLVDAHFAYHAPAVPVW